MRIDFDLRLITVNSFSVITAPNRRVQHPATVSLADTPKLVTPGDLGDGLASFVCAMRANIVSLNTITS